MHPFSILIGCLLSISLLNAQTDSASWSMQLDTFTVTTTQILLKNKGYGFNHFGQEMLTAESAIELGEFLKRRTSIFIKDYGPSGITTLSFRGGSAAQSSLIWEGVNIQNPQLGQADLSLFPISFMDQLDVMEWNDGSWEVGHRSIGACRDESKDETHA